MDRSDIEAAVLRLREQIARVIVGMNETVDLVVVALLSEGHILLEGPPGTAKTLLARTVAHTLGLSFQRIQFTPDLMPADILGTSLFDFRTNEFRLTQGPIFTQFLLADEINRAPPKTQSALLQAMQERTVTIDGRHHDLGDGFLVVATQNPIEHEGTYPLPEAQLDRFLFKIEVGYPQREDERAMIRRTDHAGHAAMLAAAAIEPVFDLPRLIEARRAIRTVRAEDSVLDYAVDVIRATREHPTLQLGASPRALVMLIHAARAHAVISGRDYLIPDDVKRLAPALLRHRIVLSPAAEIEGATSESVVSEILEKVAAPR